MKDLDVRAKTVKLIDESILERELMDTEIRGKACFFLVHTSETTITEGTVAEVEVLVGVGVRKVVSDDRVGGNRRG